MAMTLYYRRHRMQVRLADLPPLPELMPRYRWVPWSENRFNTHAQVTCRAFEREIDTKVFNNLGSWAGCMTIMQAILEKPGFCPKATWLIDCPIETIGCIQGVITEPRIGMIQNIGVLPEWRGMGIGTSLLLKALIGFRNEGCVFGQLEVTKRNHSAVRLYHELGFQIIDTFVKEAKASLPDSIAIY
jgi:GNAT superfamily N-acetyltransferase